MKINIQKIIIIGLSIYFLFFTFFNLNWSAPYYFHPDERNIASSVSQLNLTSNLNPNFFAYGQLPIYTTYFLGIVSSFLSNHFIFNPMVNFDTAILVGRIISALLAIALVFLIYKSACELKDRRAGILAFIFATTSITFFQFSHFGTFEIWLSLLLLTTSYLLLKFLKTKENIYLVLAAVVFGLSCGLKLSSLSLAIIPFFVITLIALGEKKLHLKILQFMRLFLVFTLFAVSFYIISSPFNVIDAGSFMNSMEYESGVATGAIPVFYTGSFHNQISILFTYLKVLPFLINPIVTLISIPTVLYLTYLSIKRKDKALGIFVLSFLVLFTTSTILFTKWTRYIVPSIPFLYILIAVFVSDIIKNKRYFNLAVIFLSLTGLLFSFSFIKTVRFNSDTRLAALSFAKKNIPANSSILSEVYDLGIVPFNTYFGNISLFNFYDLDNKAVGKQNELNLSLKSADYIILPSQRIYESRITHPREFPNGNKFYASLFSEKLNFKKVYQTPCDIFCKITYLGDPVFNVEQTANVFDRPTVYIFKKVTTRMDPNVYSE